MTGRPMVLVVEDERDMRKVLRVALAGRGYDVVEAATGAQALLRFREAPPNVMIWISASPTSTASRSPPKSGGGASFRSSFSRRGGKRSTTSRRSMREPMTMSPSRFARGS